MDWIRKKYWKKSLWYPWPWKSTVKVTFHIWKSESWRWLSSVIDALKMEKTVKKNPQSIFDLEIYILKVKGVCGNFSTTFYVFSASNYIRKPSKNLAYIRNKICPWIGDFEGQGCMREFFNYFFIFSAWNYIEILSQTFMTNETNFHTAKRLIAYLVVVTYNHIWSTIQELKP